MQAGGSNMQVHIFRIGNFDFSPFPVFIITPYIVIGFEVTER
jgi:hypothetical protein